MVADWPILSLIVFSPLLGIAVLLCMPGHRSNWLRTTAVAASLVPLALALWLYAEYDPAAGGAAYEERMTWISVPLNKEAFGSVASFRMEFQYHLGIDGLSLPLVLLTAVVAVMAALASVHIKKRWKAFYLWFLLLETGMLGVFLARDIILFFVFFELTLIPMFFLIGIWGLFNREKAANKFLLYNGLGSAIMLVAFVILIATAGFSAEQQADNRTFDVVYSGSYEALHHNLNDPQSYANQPGGGSGADNPYRLTDGMRTALFVLLLIAFGIKLPIFPFHTWMLRVHAEATPSIVMIHSGVLLKIGAYGLIRLGVFLFPEQAQQWAVALAALGVVNMLYGAVLAFVQTEFRLVLAYSSVSHMGIVLLGIASLNEIGLQGAVFQLVSHGLISALLFLIVGSLYERTGTTRLPELGGLARPLPFMSGLLLAAGLASLGLPGLSGFIGEFLALLGLFETQKALAALAVLGVIMAAVYVLRSVLGITYGPLNEQHAALPDARLIEAVPMIALMALIVLLGVYPSLVTDTLQQSFGPLLDTFIAREGG